MAYSHLKTQWNAFSLLTISFQHSVRLIENLSTIFGWSMKMLESIWNGWDRSISAHRSFRCVKMVWHEQILAGICLQPPQRNFQLDRTQSPPRQNQIRKSQAKLTPIFYMRNKIVSFILYFLFTVCALFFLNRYKTHFRIILFGMLWPNDNYSDISQWKPAQWKIHETTAVNDSDQPHYTQQIVHAYSNETKKK